MNTTFTLILHAGYSKAYAMEAIELARENSFALAYQKVDLAQKELVKAHRLQNQQLQQESKGVNCDVDLITIHAQDHLTAANIILDLSSEFIHLYEAMASLKQKIEV